MSHDRRPFAASIEKYPVSILRGGEDYRNVSIDLLQKGKDHAGSSDEYALRVRLDAALGNGTIQFVLGGHIGFVVIFRAFGNADWRNAGALTASAVCYDTLPTAIGAANVPPAALLASVSVDRSARGLGDVHVHGAERAALRRATGGLMTSPLGSEFI